MQLGKGLRLMHAMKYLSGSKMQISKWVNLKRCMKIGDNGDLDKIHCK